MDITVEFYTGDNIRAVSYCCTRLHSAPWKSAVTLKLDGVAPLMTNLSIKKYIFEKIYIDMGNTKIGGTLKNPFFAISSILEGGIF